MVCQPSTANAGLQKMWCKNYTTCEVQLRVHSNKTLTLTTVCASWDWLVSVLAIPKSPSLTRLPAQVAPFWKCHHTYKNHDKGSEPSVRNTF